MKAEDQDPIAVHGINVVKLLAFFSAGLYNIYRKQSFAVKRALHGGMFWIIGTLFFGLSVF